MTTIDELLSRKGREVLDSNVHVNAKEVRNNFSEIMHITDFREMRVVVTHRGKPKMALVPIRDLQLLERLDREGGTKPLEVFGSEETTEDREAPTQKAKRTKAGGSDGGSSSSRVQRRSTDAA